MIRRVTLRRFKRFESVTFDVPGHIVLAGPNNCGKTTLLQAVACWSLALGRWKELNDFQRHGGAYTKAPIARHAFYAVPLRAFDSLWNDRDYHGTVEIEIADDRGWTVTMELLADSTEQIYVRPKPAAEPDTVRRAALNTVFVPAMGGLSIDEPVYQRPKIEQLLGQGKPGDVIRNLLWEAHQDQAAWNALDESIGRLFHCRLLPPDVATADIIAQYEPLGGGPRFDIASAGSGFQQVLMLLTFLHTRPSSVLLLDEPDAHMHVIL
ncbi:MAG TPA: AAA family ATPase, partial [Pirellulales bacterium]|nr:AAA family ATPase [Pirellulales bacterium]